MSSPFSWPAVGVAVAGGAVFALGIVLPRLQLRAETRRGRSTASTPQVLPPRPSIDVIVPSYLETATIGPTVRRLRDALREYPGPSTITVVASDEATGDAAVEADADRVIRLERSGKPHASAVGAAASSADVLVFTDANCEIQPQRWPSIVVEELTRWHLVSGNKTERGTREALFWQLEASTKQRLSEAVGTLSVVGELIAIRRADYRPTPPGIVVDDLWLAAQLVFEGKRVGVSDLLQTVEDPASNKDQWGRRVRIAKGLLREQLPQLRLLSSSPEGRLFIGHKLYRLTVGCFGFWVAVAAAGVSSWPISLVLYAGVLGCAVTYSGRVMPRASLGLPISAIGMQAVPVAALYSLIRDRFRSASSDAETVGWAKVER
ncbi:glycosyltransferase [Rathayibacter sp. YIM 133350]|uniref:glycosyltransferase n=1 Tax=Rathayibacter sp. YIM 133350 TaxID=3131992 RepID=UPI00307CD031